jgi:hypothetical protein
MKAETPRLERAYARVLTQRRDNDAQARKPTRGSDVDLGHGQGHAPRVQERTSPERPTAEAYAQVIAQMDAERNPPTAERYAQVMAQMDMEDTQLHKTARWSGSGVVVTDLLGSAR